MIVLRSIDNKFVANFHDKVWGKAVDYKRTIRVPDINTSCVKFINDSILDGNRRGYKDFIIEFDEIGGFSNICAPIAGVLNYYKIQQNMSFEIITPKGGYIAHTRVESPFLVNENIENGNIKSPFDKVWMFNSEQDVMTLVKNYVFAIRQFDTISEGVIDGIDWCLSEVLDNVLQHSGIEYGYVMGQIHKNTKRINFCVFDTGVGIFNSLRQSGKIAPKNSLEAINLAMKENITRDTKIGQGNGLWGMTNLITQSRGSFKICSNGASYSLIDGKPKCVSKGELNLGKDKGTTLVDFQLDYSKSISISNALPGWNYKFVDFWVESLETDYDDNIVRIVVSKMSDGTGTRKSAQKLRNMIFNLINNDKKKIILDFEGISIISSSFADELIGKSVEQYGFMAFMKLFQLDNLTPIMNQLINRAIQQRIAQNYN